MYSNITMLFSNLYVLKISIALIMVNNIWKGNTSMVFVDNLDVFEFDVLILYTFWSKQTVCLNSITLNMTCSKKQGCKMKNIHKEVKPILQLIVIVWKQKIDNKNNVIRIHWINVYFDVLFTILKDVRLRPFWFCLNAGII